MCWWTLNKEKKERVAAQRPTQSSKVRACAKALKGFENMNTDASVRTTLLLRSNAFNDAHLVHSFAFSYPITSCSSGYGIKSHHFKVSNNEC